MKKLFKLIVIVVLLILISSIPLVQPQVSQASPALQSPTPSIPAIIDQLYLGIPAGNGHAPQRVVVDSQRQRLYTLNNGLSETGEGNTISVIDLQTGEITHLLRLNTPSRQSLLAEPYDTILSPPQVLDLQLDPYRPRLYALTPLPGVLGTGDLYADPPYSQLSIIDLDTLTVSETLPDVQAIAPGPDRLYLLSQDRLWAAHPDTLAELSRTNLQSPVSNFQSLLLNPTANRLYLSFSPTLQVFAADTLSPINTYTAPNELKQVAVDSANNRLVVIDHDGSQVSLRALDSTGRPMPTPAPFILSDDIYSDPRLTLTGSHIAVTNRTFDAYTLQLFDGTDLTLTTDFPIPAYPTSLAADTAAERVYLSYSGPPNYVFGVDLDSGANQSSFTSLTIRDALADPAAGRLYLLNDQGTLQVLSLSNYQEIGRLETSTVQRSTLERLALDSARGRLYVSGAPVQVIDTTTLTIIATLDTPGQLTPDPASNRLYLTPPCNCRSEPCNTLILNADTLTTNNAATLFPPQDVLVAPCVFATRLDAANRLLYAQIYNGVPGSNSGDYFTVFNVAGPPQELYTANDISFGQPALDPVLARAYVPRFRMSQAFIYRFEARGQTFTSTLQVAGAEGNLMYDPTFDRLYAVTGSILQVFDGDLALLSEITLPGLFAPLTFDSSAQRLYLSDQDGNLLVVAASGGQLAPPPQPRALSASNPPPPPQLMVTPGGDYFQIYNYQLYRTGANEQNWELLGRGLPDRYVTTLAISPNFRVDGTLLAGLSGPDRGGGLYRSNDGGDTWLPATRGLTDLQVKQIVFSPTFAQDRTIFASAQTGGLYRSSDGGDTWLPLAQTYTSDPASAQISDIAVSPTFARDGLVLISAGTIRRSTDGGNTWVDTGLPAGLLAFSPDFARDGLVLSEGRWRSSDGGQSWQPAAAGLLPHRGAIRLLYSPTFSTDQTVYLLAHQEYEQPLLLQRSVDAGRTWQTLLGGLPPDFSLAGAILLPTGDLYLTPQEGQPITAPANSLTWGQPTVDPTQLDLQAMVLGPDGAIYVANSMAGVLKSLDGGRTWQDTNFPARANETQEAHLAMANNGTLLAAFGSAIERSVDGGQSWTYLANFPPGFEVAAVAVSPTLASDGVILVGGNYQTKQLLRSVDGGQSWQVVYDGSQLAELADISGIAFSPNFAADQTVYAWLEYAGLLRSTDGGQNWSALSSQTSMGIAQSMLIAPNGRLYLGGLYALAASDDGGQSWLNLSQAIPDEHTWHSALALGSNNSLFLGTDIGVYRSRDQGQSWSRASAGLPLDPDRNMPRAIRALHLYNGRLYAALVKDGVFVSDDEGQSWQSAATASPLTPNLPPPPPPMRPTATQPAAPPPPACPSPPANFADLWAGRVAQLGCPTASQRSIMVEQNFEGGLMFWRSDTRSIYVLPLKQPFASFADTWDQSQPVYLCPEFGPPQTPPTPQHGFGKVWCTQPQVRQLLGRATSTERSFEALIQEFATGLILQTDQRVIYIFENGGNRWESK